MPLIIHLDQRNIKQKCWINFQIINKNTNKVIQHWDGHYFDLYNRDLESTQEDQEDFETLSIDSDVELTFAVRQECGGQCYNGKIWMAFACMFNMKYTYHV